jgi:broad-specificity NMP kinase
MSDKIIFLTGTSGTGKTTVLRELTNLDIETIGIDEEPDLAYWVNKNGSVYEGETEFDEEFLKNHEWVCDFAVLTKMLDQKNRPVVICGSCDNFKAIIDIADITLVLHCLPEVFLDRIEKRTDNEYGKSDDAKKLLLDYYEDYYKECLDLGAKKIDATKTIKQVLNDVLGYIRN